MLSVVTCNRRGLADTSPPASASPLLLQVTTDNISDLQQGEKTEGAHLPLLPSNLAESRYRTCHRSVTATHWRLPLYRSLLPATVFSQVCWQPSRHRHR